jgi:hypothetical protein
MRYKQKKLYCILIIVILSTVIPLYARTTITNTSNITPQGLTDAIDQFQNMADLNGPAIANAQALANIGGYPMGSAYLGGIPHFLIGVSFNAGLANMDTQDPDKKHTNGKFPVMGLNPVIYAGVGIAKGVDLLGKIMLFSDGFYKPPLNYSYANLSKLNLYSIGGKLRFNYIGEQKIVPGIFSFGGLTFSAGADLLYGIIGINGSYKYKITDIEVSTGVPIPPTYKVEINFNSDYSCRVSWYLMSINPQVLAYFNFFWLLNLYTGFGFPINYGSFQLKLHGNGNIETDDDNYALIVGSGPPNSLGSIEVSSENKYHPLIFMPVYIIGFDLDLIILKLTFESMVNLWNRSDVNIQLGTRIQF